MLFEPPALNSAPAKPSPRNRPHLRRVAVRLQRGRLHGTWLDATADADEMNDGISRCSPLRPYRTPKWAIPRLRRMGTAPSPRVRESTRSPASPTASPPGLAFAHWAALVGTDADLTSTASTTPTSATGPPSRTARDHLDDCGLDHIIEEHVGQPQPRLTVGVDGFAQDLEYSGDITASEGDDGVYLYANY